MHTDILMQCWSHTRGATYICLSFYEVKDFVHFVTSVHHLTYILAINSHFQFDLIYAFLNHFCNAFLPLYVLAEEYSIRHIKLSNSASEIFSWGVNENSLINKPRIDISGCLIYHFKAFIIFPKCFFPANEWRFVQQIMNFFFFSITIDNVVHCFFCIFLYWWKRSLEYKIVSDVSFPICCWINCSFVFASVKRSLTKISILAKCV